MENANQWYFTKEELACSPSRKHGIDVNKELSYRQQAANFIQDMGQRLQVSQLCINTAIVYMHRFYVFHSFTEIHRNNLSVAALFLAAKVEEQPRKLEHVIKVAHICLHKDAPPLDVRSECYAEKQFEVVNNESILLQTLGFMLAIEHPHTYVVKVCQLVKACKDLAQTSYFMATTSLHMTTMCLQYKPTLVACVCIHLACKWSSWKIEPCSEGKEWYYYVDKTVTLELLENLTQEFIAILENSPHRFKRKFIPQKQEPGGHTQKSGSDDGSKHHHSSDKSAVVKKENPLPGPSASFNLSQTDAKPVSVKVENSEKHPAPSQPVHSPQTPKKNKASSSHSILSIDAYREKKEKERLEQKSAPPAVAEPQAMNKLPHAANDHDKVHNKHVSNSVESSHSHSKSSKSKEHHHHQVHSASSANKINHLVSSKKLESLPHSKESKGNALKLPPSVVSDPVVVLERVDMKTEPKELPASEPVFQAAAVAAATSKLMNTQDYKYPVPPENLEQFVPSVPVTSSPVPIKTKHHKHKTNSVRSNNNSVHPHTYKSSPVKDLKTNGSKETDSNERRNAVVENNISVKTEISSKHEKREKYKTKHSYNSSKDKVIVNSEPSNPAIKVKIRKEDINKLPIEKSQKFQPSVKVESTKKPLKIKISKPPVPPEPIKMTTPLKLVITKDKSGSGSYCTSQKNERESKKRAHSPSSHEANYKSSSGENPSKYAKLDHSHSSHSSNAKQSKSRHSSSRNMDHAATNNVASSNKLLHQANDSTGYLNVDVENYTGQPYYGNQYFPYQVPPPPPPPSAPGYRSKTNFNLSAQLPQPPPPPSLPPPE